MSRYSLIIVLLMILFISCDSKDGAENDNNNIESSFGSNFIKYDLSEYEIPIVVDAPIGAEIEAGVGNGSFGGVRTINYEITKGDFVLDVNHIVGAKYEKENLIGSERLFAEEITGFESFVLEEENGFIYKVNTEEGVDYGFYYVTFKDGAPVEFGVGFSYSNFTLEQVQKMYAAAKAAK